MNPSLFVPDRPGLSPFERLLLALVALGLAASLTVHFAYRNPHLDVVVDNARWTVEIFFGLAVAILRWREAVILGEAGIGGPCPRPRACFACGIGAYGAGQLAWGLGVATGTETFPGPPDFFFLLLPVFVALGLFPVLDRELQGKKRRAVWLDVAGLVIMVATLAAALYLPNQGRLGNGTLVVLLLYPIFFLGLFGQLMMTIVVRRIRPEGGILAAAAGLGLLATAWLMWNLAFLKGETAPGSLTSYLFSLGHVALFFGLATARERVSEEGVYVRWLDRLHRLLPLLFVLAAGVGVAYGVRRFEEDPDGGGHAVGFCLYAGAAAMVLCAMLRQILLLFEQDRELAAEQRLRERELYYQAIFENSSDLILQLRVDPDGRNVRYCGINPAGLALIGVDLARFLGSTPSEYFGPVKGAVFEANYRRCLAEGQPIQYELPITPPSGSLILATNLVPIRDEAGRITHLLAVSRNITAQKNSLDAVRALNAQLEHRIAERTAELEAAYREMEAFSYSVSHDLRSPLRGINGFCNALIEDFGALLPDDGRRYLDRVRHASRRMGQIIDDLLALSRVSRSAVAPVDGVNLSALALRISETLRASSPERGPKVAFAVSLGLLDRCDPRLMEHVLENLLGNAWKYTSRHETARIEFGSLIRREGAEGHFQRRVYYVRDDGAGFDMAFAGKLFQNFQRLHSQAEFEGTGVGLAIVARIIHRHGGRIWAEGEVGKGAAFYFTLGEDAPAHPPATPPHPAAAP